MYKGSRWDQEDFHRHRICHSSLGEKINRGPHHRILYLKLPGWIVDRWVSRMTVTGPVLVFSSDPEDPEMIDLEDREMYGRQVGR
jgi:hypothetical protein